MVPLLTHDRADIQPELLTDIAQEEIGYLDQSIDTCNAVYLPQLGFLVSIPAPPGKVTEQELGLPGLEFMVSSVAEPEIHLSGCN